MSRFELISQGNIARKDPRRDPMPLAVGPRTAIARSGEIVCSYMVQQKLGVNDFVMMTARSSDGGATWREIGPTFPHLQRSCAVFMNISRAPSGDLMLFGARTRIDTPGEPSWSDATKGLKPNELIWSRSRDDAGAAWSEPTVIPMPIAGSAEAPGPMLVTRRGRWICVYAPYNVFDPKVTVDRHQIVLVMSDDEGTSWRHTSMLRFDETDSGGAEAWVCELSDGTLLGTAWHCDLSDRDPLNEYPNKYAISRDGGSTWSKTRSTGTIGHTTALTALPDGRALFLNVRRRKREPSGIWLSVVRPNADDFGVESDDCVWTAQSATQSSATDPTHDQWTNFSFGEPSVTLLPDRTLLLAFWYAQNEHSGIKYLKLKMR